MSKKLKQTEISDKSERPDADKLLNRLVADFPPEVVSKHIQRLLDATVPMKHGERPDPNAIATALKFLLAYRIGEPVKRIAVADVSERETNEDTLARLAASPAAMRALAATLSEMPGGREAMDSALRTGKTMEAVEVPVES